MKETAVDTLITGVAMIWFVFSVSVLFMCIKADDAYLEAFINREDTGLVRENSRDEEKVHKVSYQQVVAQIDYPDREYDVYVNGLLYDNDGTAFTSDDVPEWDEFIVTRTYKNGRICKLSYTSVE